MKLFGQSLICLALGAVQLPQLTQGAVAPGQSPLRKRSFLNSATESKSYSVKEGLATIVIDTEPTSQDS